MLGPNKAKWCVVTWCIFAPLIITMRLLGFGAKPLHVSLNERREFPPFPKTGGKYR
jgi:hypothetical protein